ncbi:biotin/lipoate A/B protein ligase family protein [Paenibacillus farraposensis]|uniref:Biotin/lipoate A/B protein ligase family protein n=1 Tax=Paenibacillus farraposensis TaxID=2807095 RepID=A0ABW4DIE3_9BACL|nr:lipoate--protein ligase family protein [Paenibacillus farraposensis]MCC3379147.1 lipoate--protein ligase family protein [Paenibacillus farraposensis]
MENVHSSAAKTTVLPDLQWYEAPLTDTRMDVLSPLAWEELACRQVGKGAAPVMHLWRHPSALVIGHRDRRLPYAPQAMERMRSAGISVCVRPSGGAAVMLDRGVLNLSLILPNPQRAISLHEDFRLMAGLIAEALAPWSAEAQTGEITGSFCPGDYDVSVRGRKFCGIAQRRQAKAYIITAFVMIEGSGTERAQAVQRFYAAAAGDTPADMHQPDYPRVNPATMGSLAELAGVPSVEAYTASLRRVIESRAAIMSVDRSLVQPQGWAEQMAALRDRYDLHI